VEEAEEGRGSVEGVVPAAEGGVAEDAEPRLAGEGGAEEVLGLVGREAEEDLADELVHQLPPPPWCGSGCEGFDWGGKRRRGSV
jgi:hypothetical protein